METKTAGEIAKGVFDALNRRDLARLADYLAEDVTVTAPMAFVSKGRDALFASAQQQVSAMPDLHFEVVDILSGESKVGVEYVWTATHTSEMDLGPGFGKIAPTGKQIANPGFWVMTIKDGKITTIAQYFDELGMLTQLGLLPAPALAPA